MENIITLSEAAQIASTNTSTLRYAIKAGRLKAYRKVGKTWLVERSRLQEWIDNPALHKRGVKSKK